MDGTIIALFPVLPAGLASALPVSPRLLEIQAGLGRYSDPLILDRPITVLADQLEHNPSLRIDPLVEPLEMPVVIRLNIKQPRGTTRRRRVTDGYPACFSDQLLAYRQSIVRDRQDQQLFLLGEDIPDLGQVRSDDFDRRKPQLCSNGRSVLQPDAHTFGIHVDERFLAIDSFDERAGKFRLRGKRVAAYYVRNRHTGRHHTDAHKEHRTPDPPRRALMH